MKTNKMGITLSSRARVWKSPIVLLAAATCVLFPMRAQQAPPAEKVDKAVETALLAEDWKTVTNLLASVSPATPSLVRRMIKGHACLALNANNESLCLFLSTSSEQALPQWIAWATEFASRHPKAAVALYFQGDAQARMKRWDAALKYLCDAARLQPRNSLVLNSRGAVYAAKGQWDTALIDFDDATRAVPSLADAYSSLGAMWIQRRTGPIGAYNAFTNALRLSPDFALALNGRGCAQFALGRWEDALKDLQKAAEKSDCFNIALMNAATLASLKRDFDSRESSKLAQLKPGMSVEAKGEYVKSLTPQEAPKAYAKAEWDRKWSQGSAVVLDAMAGIAGKGSDRRSSQLDGNVGLGAKGPSISGINISGNAGVSGNVKNSSERKWDLATTFKDMANQSRNDAADHAQSRDLIGSKFGQQLSPKGITAEDLQHAFVDIGKWLDTGYGLAYQVEPVKLKQSETKATVK